MSTANGNGLEIRLGKTLPYEIMESMASVGTGSVMNLPRQLIIMGLSDYREEDLSVFEGPARFRMGLGKTFMILSPEFEGLSFDMIWSPVIARNTKEPPMPKPAEGEHALFSFVLVDGSQTVRGIRVATISENVALAIWRAQQGLEQRSVTEEALSQEMMALFQKYPQGIPEVFFHEACDFGD